MAASRLNQSFLSQPIHRLFCANVLPILFSLIMNGLLNLVDAIFLGHYVGADALAAISLIFPIIMLMIALSVLINSGMTSLLARSLGASNQQASAAVFAQVHGLAFCIAIVLVAAYFLFGKQMIEYLTVIRDSQQSLNTIKAMAHTYLLVMIIFSPIQFLLGIHADVWRNEGHASLIAKLSMIVTSANIALNYLLIAVLDFGIAGSAWGTIIAQFLGLSLLISLRYRRTVGLSMHQLFHNRWIGKWLPIIRLGFPLSLSFLGIATVSATVIFTLRFNANAGYTDIIAAYGVVTRIFSFIFLPIMAFGLATQIIVGHNAGAKSMPRAFMTLRLALLTAWVYCFTIEIILWMVSHSIGQWFVSDEAVVRQVSFILRRMSAAYTVIGPVLVLAMYFQAIGKSSKTALLTLPKPFILLPLLIWLFNYNMGEQWLWYAFPIADLAIALVALILLIDIYQSRVQRLEDTQHG